MNLLSSANSDAGMLSKEDKKRFCQLIFEHHAFLRAKPGKPFVTKSGRTSDYFINFGVFHSSGGIRSLAKFYAKAIHQWLDETNLLTNKNASSDATHLPSTEGKTAITLEGSDRQTTAKNIPPTRVIIFGPAYKGIPLSVATAMELSVILDSQTNPSPQGLESNRPSPANSRKEEKLQVHYCFNRKESKKHGEGGDFIGPKLRETDIVFITDDVLTAGTAMTEIIKKLQAIKNAPKNIFALVGVNRMEKGLHSEKSAAVALQEKFSVPLRALIDIQQLLEFIP